MTLQDSLKVIIESLTKKLGKTQKQVNETISKVETKADKKYVDGKLVIRNESNLTASQKEVANLVVSPYWPGKRLYEYDPGLVMEIDEYTPEGKITVPYILFKNIVEEGTTGRGDGETTSLFIRAYPAELVNYENNTYYCGYENSRIDQYCRLFGDRLVDLYDFERSTYYFGTSYIETEDSSREELETERFCFTIPNEYDKEAIDAVCDYYRLVPPGYQAGTYVNYKLDPVLKKFGNKRIWRTGHEEDSISYYDPDSYQHSDGGNDLEYHATKPGYVWPCIALNGYRTPSSLSTESKEHTYLLNLGDDRWLDIGKDITKDYIKKDDLSKAITSLGEFRAYVIDLEGQEITNRLQNLAPLLSYQAVVSYGGSVYLKNFKTTASEMHDCNALINMMPGRSSTYKGVYNEVGFDGQIHTYIITIDIYNRIKLEEIS